jgi:hypothetical protein
MMNKICGFVANNVVRRSVHTVVKLWGILAIRLQKLSKVGIQNRFHAFLWYKLYNLRNA